MERARAIARSSFQRWARPHLVRAVGGFSWAEEHAFLQRWFVPQPGPLVDLACGGGEHGRLLATWHGRDRVLALDLDAAVLAQARREPGGPLAMARADAGDLPLASGGCGGLICFGGLSLFPDVDRALAEVSRVLQPGAPFVAACPRRRPSLPQRVARRLSGQRFMPDEGWRSLLRTHGLQPMQVHGRGWTVLVAARRAAHNVTL